MFLVISAYGRKGYWLKLYFLNFSRFTFHANRLRAVRSYTGKFVKNEYIYRCRNTVDMYVSAKITTVLFESTGCKKSVGYVSSRFLRIHLYSYEEEGRTRKSGSRGLCVPYLFQKFGRAKSGVN